MRRRHFLTISAAAGGLAAQPKPARVPLRFFTEDEALTIAAACARIFPTDEFSPGANEAAVVIYIDRQLAGGYGKDRYRYTRGPFVEGLPEHGYQGSAAPRQIYRDGLKLLTGFAQKPPAEQDQTLKQIENSLFFSLLRTHTIEGMFCDPMHGGNKDKIGWQIVGFPGPRMSFSDEVETYHGRPFRPKPQSLSEVLGRPVRPSEDDPS